MNWREGVRPGRVRTATVEGERGSLVPSIRPNHLLYFPPQHPTAFRSDPFPTLDSSLSRNRMSRRVSPAAHQVSSESEKHLALPLCRTGGHRRPDAKGAN